MLKNNTKEYSVTREVDLYEENSFGITREKNAVKTKFTVCIKADDYGWFEIDGGNDWYAEGGLWFEGKTLTDYDGVFNLSDVIIGLLEEKGFNCDEVK
jgi:hypothetical protein